PPPVPLESTYMAPETAIQATLVQIWGQVLRLDQVGIHDNFFALGGDSILSIQIVARARQAGLTLTVKQLFQQPTIARLAAVVDRQRPLQAEQGLAQGPVPLTPIQCHFFARAAEEPAALTQGVILRKRQDSWPLQPVLLRQALEHLLIHHDALRLRFVRTPDGWLQYHGEPATALSFYQVDLAHLREQTQHAVLTALTSQVHSQMQQVSGPLVFAVFCTSGERRPARVLLRVHHLVVDTVSWRILLADLDTIYEQLSQGQPVSLPTKTTSFQHWATRLLRYASSEELLAQSDYWLTPGRLHGAELPLDCSPEEAVTRNTRASACTITLSLSREETTALLQEVPNAYHTRINEVLLTALAQALALWTQQPRLLVDLEGHGREELFADVDVSRTVGWFTTL